MTDLSELVEIEFADLEVGQAIDEDVTWTPEEIDTFRSLTGDDAPVHRDDAFAREVGFAGPIAFGLLIASPFSRLLGCRLPGILSVIQSFRFEFAQPVLVGEPLRYSVTVTQLSPATKSVSLELKVERPDGAVAGRGRAQCGLAR